MRKTKTLKDQQQKQQENGKAELEEIREDNIEAAKKTKIENNQEIIYKEECSNETVVFRVSGYECKK